MSFLKSLGAALYERVFVHYKPTLIGIAAGAGIVAVDQFTTFFQSLPQGWAKAVAGIVVIAGSFLKQKLAEKAEPAALP